MEIKLTNLVPIIQNLDIKHDVLLSANAAVSIKNKKFIKLSYREFVKKILDCGGQEYYYGRYALSKFEKSITEKYPSNKPVYFYGCLREFGIKYNTVNKNKILIFSEEILPNTFQFSNSTTSLIFCIGKSFKERTEIKFKNVPNNAT